MAGRFAWNVLFGDSKCATALAETCGIDSLTAQLLLNRGISKPTEARRFLSPGLEALDNPLELPDMAKAVTRIHKAISAGQRILVFGDADLDGITSSAILYELLTGLGASVTVRLSNRLKDGYGFPGVLIKRLAHLRIGLLILVDCGTNQADEIWTLARHGVETIIFDHHVPMQRMARPFALVNPYLGLGIGQELSSAGLALKLVQAMCPGDAAQLDRAFDLAALGTLADYAPLVGQNRVLVAVGLERIFRTHRPGLKQLCEAAQLVRPTPEQILRRLVPWLNAAGRLGDPSPAWKLLVERSGAAASLLVETLRQAHAETKALLRQIVAVAHEQASRISFRDHYVMVIARRGWHPGLMGPIASQLVERYWRPAIAIALDGRVGTGSGRSIPAFNLFEALRVCEGMLLRYGGHPRACGLTLKAENLEILREKINQHAHASLGRSSLARTLQIDAELRLRDITTRVASTVEQFRPFGPGNPRPCMLLRKVGIEPDPATGGWLTDGLRRIRIRGRFRGLLPGESYDVVASPAVAEEKVVLTICDARLSAVQKAGQAGVLATAPS